MSDDTRGISSQSIINTVERESEERSIVNDSVRSSIHSNWSDLVPVDIESEYRKIYGNRRRPDTKVCAITPLTTPPADIAALPTASPATHKTIKNIRLVPMMPKPHEWGSWNIKSHHTSSTANTPNATQKEEELGREEEEGELAYEPHSPYYSPVHLPEFYEDE